MDARTDSVFLQERAGVESGVVPEGVVRGEGSVEQSGGGGECDVVDVASETIECLSRVVSV